MQRVKHCFLRQPLDVSSPDCTFKPGCVYTSPLGTANTQDQLRDLCAITVIWLKPEKTKEDWTMLYTTSLRNKQWQTNILMMMIQHNMVKEKELEPKRDGVSLSFSQLYKNVFAARDVDTGEAAKAIADATAVLTALQSSSQNIATVNLDEIEQNLNAAQRDEETTLEENAHIQTLVSQLPLYKALAIASRKDCTSGGSNDYLSDRFGVSKLVDTLKSLIVRPRVQQQYLTIARDYYDACAEVGVEDPRVSQLQKVIEQVQAEPVAEAVVDVSETEEGPKDLRKRPRGTVVLDRDGTEFAKSKVKRILELLSKQNYLGIVVNYLQLLNFKDGRIAEALGLQRYDVNVLTKSLREDANFRATLQETLKQAEQELE